MIDAKSFGSRRGRENVVACFFLSVKLRPRSPKNITYIRLILTAKFCHVCVRKKHHKISGNGQVTLDLMRNIHIVMRLRPLCCFKIRKIGVDLINQFSKVLHHSYACMLVCALPIMFCTIYLWTMLLTSSVVL